MKIENYVTDLGLSQKLYQLHKPDETMFYWSQGDVYTEEEGWTVNYRSRITKRDGVDLEWYPAYTAGELLEILPGCIPAKYLSELFEIPVITAAGGDEWEKQNEVREQALGKLKHFMRDWDDFNPMYDIDDVMMDNEKWPYDLLLAYQPGRSVYYYADDADAEYWQVCVEMKVRDKHDRNLAHLMGRMLKHCFQHGVIKGDNGQGKLI